MLTKSFVRQENKKISKYFPSLLRGFKARQTEIPWRGIPFGGGGVCPRVFYGDGEFFFQPCPNSEPCSGGPFSRRRRLLKPGGEARNTNSSFFERIGRLFTNACVRTHRAEDKSLNGKPRRILYLQTFAWAGGGHEGWGVRKGGGGKRIFLLPSSFCLLFEIVIDLR